MEKKLMILALWPLNSTPSSRFRIGQYLSLFEKYNINYGFFSFFSLHDKQIIKSRKNVITKSLTLFLCYIKCFKVLHHVRRFDLVFVHREFTPFGQPFIIWTIAKIFKKRIVYDFDDAIWYTDNIENKKLKLLLRNPGKMKNIIKLAWKVSCGNQYLLNFAKSYNENVVLNPTTIDTENLHKKLKNQFSERVTIGWTGSSTTLKYLDSIAPVLKQLENEINFDFIVICNKKPEWDLKSLVFIDWNLETEIDDLLRINIGIMPLPNDEWSNGKCGFKAIQYMSLGMPALVSPVGVNKNIVDHDINGFYCDSHEDWIKYIKLLYNDAELRAKMGINAREKIEQKFSIKSNELNFIGLFNSIE